MKRLLSILIAIALMLSMSVTAFALDSGTGNLSITRGSETYYYEYIAEAFEEAKDGDIIKVERDYTEEKGIIFCGYETLQSVTFDLNGREIHFPEDSIAFEDHGIMYVECANITFIDTVGSGIFHAIVTPYENAVVKSGTYRGFWPQGDVTIEGGTFLGLPQDIVDRVDVWGDMEKQLIGTKGLLLTTWERVFSNEDEARAALDAIIADDCTADKPYDITSYEADNGSIRYSAGFAANTSIVKTDSKTTTVTYEVAPAYIVTIPENVTIDGNATTISAENVVVNKGQYVSVSLDAANNFTVTTREGATLTYTVNANGEALAAGDEILAVNPADGKTGSASVIFAIDESAIQYAGTYTGTATFTVAVKDVPKTIINFTIEGTSYTAEEGMTWAEWLDSSYCGAVFYDWGMGFVGNDEGYVVCHPNAADWLYDSVNIDETIEKDFAYVLLYCTGA